MSCSSVTLLLNQLPMADTCFVGTPKTLFCKTQHPFLSLSSKRPIKLSFSATSRSWVSFQQPEKSSSLRIIPLVVQASDWAQQGGGGGGGGNGENLSWENQGVVEGSVDGDGGKVDYGEPCEDAKLFVGNLPYDVDSESLAQFFNQAGVVEISEVMFNRQTDQSRGFGFVTMSTVEEAQKAVEMFNGYEMNGRLLTVNKAAPRGSQPERSRSYRIYVGNLPWQVDDARLVQIFSEHGKVVSGRVVSDQETSRSRGFGFVTMSDELSQNNAIAALDGQSLDGRAIRVSVAEQRSRRGSFL